MEYLWLLLLVICGASATDENTHNEDNLQRFKRQTRGSRGSQATWRKTVLANRIFAHKLYRNVARTHPEGNLMISPFVVSTGLSMILLGAGGSTERELMETLEYSAFKDSKLGRKRNGQQYAKRDVPRFFQSLIRKTRRNALEGGYALTIASKLYGEQTETFLPDFIRNTDKYYDARFEEVDFAGHPDEAREAINAWANDKTNGVIPEALPAGSVTSATLLALVSTAYFKGEWENTFDPSNTEPGLFHMRDGTEQTVDYMYGKFSLLYKQSKKLNSDILVLPYKSRNPDYKVQMELYLPGAENGDIQQIESMAAAGFHHELRGLRPFTVDLYLPKFRMSFGVDLAQNLKTLGLVSLFGAADLSGMNGKHNLNLANAIHKSFIEVNEEGTTAGSSLGLLMNKSAQEFELRFERPFIFIIREKATNTILFMGRVENPI